MLGYPWALNQENKIKFVMIDAAGIELTGLTLTVQISKNDAGDADSFAASAGTWGEIGSGFYWYKSTAAEANTVGPLAVKVTAPGAIQQNLIYPVVTWASTAIERTYTVYEPDGITPIDGVTIEIYNVASDAGNPTWLGRTNVLGVAVDDSGNKPRLISGTWYFYRRKGGYNFTNPDTETYS